MFDLGSDVEDHLLGRRVLHLRAIDKALDTQGLRIADFVGRHDPRTRGPVRIEAFAHHHGRSARLPIAHTYVVAAHITCDDLARAIARDVAAAPANDDDELGLPIDLTRDLGNIDRIARADDAGCL